MKICETCKIKKNLIHFGKASRAKDGLRGRCKECRTTLEKTKKAYKQEYYLKNSDKIKEASSKWQSENKEHRKEYMKQYSKLDSFKATKKSYSYTNMEYLKEYNKTYYEQNKEILLDNNKRYRKEYIKTNRYKNLHKAAQAKRRAAKLQRTPKWADLDKIREIYLNCPKGYHVDHVVPLQGNKVSGFHIEYNLQYLTALENCSKSNKF